MTRIDALLRELPLCTVVVTTGQKATDVLCDRFSLAQQPPVGGFVTFWWEDRNMRFYRMPSSSRAYPLKLEAKAEKYRVLLQLFRKFG